MAADKEMVPLEEAKEQVRRVCRRLGLLHLSFAKTLAEELGEETGRQLALKAIRDYATKIAEEVKRDVIARGLDTAPQNYKEDLPLYGMHERMEVVEVDGEPRIRAYGCVMAKVWQEYGEDKLGRLYCYVDPAKYMVFNPDFKLVHTKSIPDGDEYCELVIRPTTERERTEFADKDSDWSSVDK